MSDAMALIIEVALNGGTPKVRNRHVPRSVPEIVEDGLGAGVAGALAVTGASTPWGGTNATQPTRTTAATLAAA